MNYYEILGVEEDATDDEIKKGYKVASMKAHPDKGGDSETFAKVTTAYDVLSDVDKRKLYDAYGEDAPMDGYEKMLAQIMGQVFNEKNRDHISDPYRAVMAFTTQVTRDITNAEATVKALGDDIEKLNSHEDAKKYPQSLTKLTDIHRFYYLGLLELQTVKGICEALKEELEIMAKVLGKDTSDKVQLTHNGMRHL